MSNRRLKPTPKNLLEVTQAEITPYLASGKQPNDRTVFTKNRANDISWRDDKQKDVSISLLDIDNAIYYYFNEIIKPTIVQDGQRIKVPVMFGTPERWKSVQADGFFRDSNDKLTAPLIMFKRDSITKNRELGNKLDGNKAHLFQVFEERYNPRNAYDKFSIITNRIPSKKMYATVVPDYVTVTYNCVIFTDYVEQNNKLIEAIEFASDSYWGDFNRFHFRTKIDSFATTTIIEVDQDRAAKTSFTFTVNGYIIPDSVNKELANMDGFYTKSQVIFDLETTTADLDRFTAAPSAKVSAMGATSFTADGGFVGGSGGSGGGGASAADLTYLNTNKSAEATSVTSNTATFGGQLILEPSAGSSLPATDASKFTFYAGSIPIPPGAITSFAGSTNPVLTINAATLGYDLTGLTITAIGKFQ
jgi:hypothetical protein